MDFKTFDSVFYSENISEILHKIVPIFYKIYRIYFSHEISLSEDKKFIVEESLKKFLLFCSEFNICPGMLPKRLISQIFQDECFKEESDKSISQNIQFFFHICENLNLTEISKKEPKNKNILGSFFTFFKFLRVLFYIGGLAYEKLNNELNNNNNQEDNFTYDEMIIMFLQKIETSEGFNNFQLKSNQTKNIDRIVDDELLNIVNKNSNENTKNNNNEDIILFINDNYGKDLNNIFKTICSYGDAFNYSKLKSKNFNKFLNETGLIKNNNNNNFGIESKEIDTLFIKLSQLNKNDENINNNNKKINKNNFIDYKSFLFSIDIIANMLYNELDEKDAIEKILNENIFPVFLSDPKKTEKINGIEEKIEYLKELQSNQDFIKLCEIIFKKFNTIFNFYSINKSNKLMNKKGFFNFCKDFEIFPNFISKLKLNLFYDGIAQYSSYGNDNDILIEQSLFIDLITLIALEINLSDIKEVNPIEKMIILLDKIYNSNGFSVIIKKTGNNKISENNDIMEEIRNNFPEYFENEEEIEETEEK